MVPKSDHLANTRFDKKPSAQVKFKVPDGFEQLSEFQGPYVAMEYDSFVQAGE